MHYRARQVICAALICSLSFIIFVATSCATTVHAAEATKVYFQASTNADNTLIRNSLTVSTDRVSIWNTLEAKGNATIGQEPLADAPVALHVGDFVVATTRTDSAGDYAFSAPLGLYYFPSAMRGQVAIYTVVTPPAGGPPDTPSNVTNVTVDPFFIFVDIKPVVFGTLIAVTLIALTFYAWRLNRSIEQLRDNVKQREAGQSRKRLARIYIDFISSLKILVRGGSSLFWVLAFPIIVMLVLGSIYSEDVTYKLAIQNNDNSSTSAALVNAFNSTRNLTVTMVGANQDPDAYVKSSGIGSILIIPAGFGKDVQRNVAFRNASSAAGARVNSTTVGRNNTTLLNVVNLNQGSLTAQNSNTARPAQLTLKVDQSQLITRSTAGIVNSVAKSFVEQLSGSGQIANVTTQNALPSKFKYIDFFVPGIVSLAVLTIGVLGTCGTYTELRETGILKRLASTPLGKSDWLTAKIFYQCVVVFVSAALIFVVAKLVYNVNTVPNPVIVILLVAGTICFTGIGMIVARFVESEDAATAASMAVIFPMLFLCGTFQPLATMPDYVQTIAKVLPLTFLTNGLRDAMIFGDIGAALYNACVLFLIGIVLFVIGAIITDWREK
jgi:ABC-2 type transport system permease protein